ncbi:hypothetical protein HPP92_027268 [Vanilla planifolia]|uniref:Uncharacterized protein n=1 Tax=Vanilla planifolia TaxID=51239 RepID=A0A835U5S1_VANPL|nr:hypothetical protein HPP92_027268 [Vanilla planifolia]
MPVSRKIQLDLGIPRDRSGQWKIRCPTLFARSNNKQRTKAGTGKPEQKDLSIGPSLGRRTKRVVVF